MSIESLPSDVYAYLSQYLSEKEIGDLSICSKALHNSKLTEIFFNKLPAYLNFISFPSNTVTPQGDLKAKMRDNMSRLVKVGAAIFGETLDPTVGACIKLQQKISDSLDKSDECEKLLDVSCDEVPFYESLLAISCTKIAGCKEMPTDLYTHVEHALDMHTKIFLACHAAPSLKEVAWKTLPRAIYQPFIERVMGQLFHCNIEKVYSSSDLDKLYAKHMPKGCPEELKKFSQKMICCEVIREIFVEQLLKDTLFVFPAGLKEGLTMRKQILSLKNSKEIFEQEPYATIVSYLTEFMKQRFVDNDSDKAADAATKLQEMFEGSENLIEQFKNLDLT